MILRFGGQFNNFLIKLFLKLNIDTFKITYLGIEDR